MKYVVGSIRASFERLSLHRRHSKYETSQRLSGGLRRLVRYLAAIDGAGRVDYANTTSF